MYKVYAIKGSTTYLIYNDISPDVISNKLIDPKLSMQDNAAGSFTCKVPQGNIIYDDIEPMITYIRITRDDEWLWTGRVLTIKKDFWLNKSITCEGALAFLNDVALPQQKWSNSSIVTFISGLLGVYNTHASTFRQINPGAISTSTSSGSPIGLRDYISEGESPLKHITTIAEDWGLHIRIRENSNDGQLYLDMLTDTQLPTNSQQIDFGKNLLDYADETDWTDLITVLHPLGTELETYNKTSDEDYPDKLTISGKTPSDPTTFGIFNNEYLYNKSAVNKFGRIEETVEWSEVDDADTLIELAELYLNDFKYYNIKLTVKVVDLHYLNVSTAGFKMLSKIVCKSSPHNVFDEFIIDKMDIPLDKPEQTTFTFSRCTMGYYTADRPNQGYGRGTISGINVNTNTFSKASVLNAAKASAAQLILSNTHGYVSLNMDANNDHVVNLTIRNNSTEETSTQEWLWNLNGLMYRDRTSINSSWNNPHFAITMDGQIVANMITTGTLQVAASGGGLLFSADMTYNTVHIAGFTVKDDALYTNNKSTLGSTSNGIYVGTNGVSSASGDMYMAFSNGEIYGTSSGDYGYIQFISPEQSSGTLGLRLAGRGFVGLITNGWIGVRTNWWNRTASGNCTFSSGISSSLNIYNGDGSLYTTLEFLGGICTGWHV